MTLTCNSVSAMHNFCGRVLSTTSMKHFLVFWSEYITENKANVKINLKHHFVAHLYNPCMSDSTSSDWWGWAGVVPFKTYRGSIASRGVNRARHKWEEDKCPLWCHLDLSCYDFPEGLSRQQGRCSNFSVFSVLGVVSPQVLVLLIVLTPMFC